MNSRTILIVVALLIALATAYVARTMMTPDTPQQASTAPVQQAQADTSTHVLVAKDTLPAGLILKPENLAWQVWPTDGLPDTYVVDTKGGKLEDYVGAVVRQTLSKGDPITSSRVAKPADRGFMAAVLTPGMRAVTINVNTVTGTPGFIFPGDHVDLILTQSVQIPGSEQQTTSHRTSETVMRDLRVIGTNMQTDNPTGAPVSASNFTFEVTPKQAEKVALLREMGTLSAVLRSIAADDQAAVQPGAKLEKNTADTHTLTWDSQVSQALPAAANGGGGRTVTVARGSSSELMTFRRN